MKNRRFVILLISLTVLAVSCGFFGAFNNPVDPLSDAYQGFMSLDIKDMAVGYQHVLAATNAGPVYSWGWDSYRGVLGWGRTAGTEPTPGKVKNYENAESVRCGDLHSVSVDIDGGLWGWGCNIYHQLGTDASGVILSDEYYTKPVRLRDDVIAAACGSDFSACIDGAGSIYVRGSLGASENYEDGNTTYTADLMMAIPESLTLPDGRTAVDLVCGYNSVVALASDGTVWQWGGLSGGELEYEVFTQIFGLSGVEHISGSGNVFLAAEADGTLWTWGNYDTELWGGDGYYGDNPAAVPLTAAGFTSIAAGRSFALAVTEAGELYGWGENFCGALGLPYWMFNLEEPYRIDSLYDGFDFSGASVYAGRNNAFVNLSDGSLFSWGSNNDGVLGIGKQYAPTMSLDRCRVSFSETGIEIIDAAGGGGFGAALASDGSIWCWGRNDHGQLGLGHTSFTVEPEQVPPGPVITSIAAGVSFSAALDESGTLWGCGENANGQLATGDTTDSSVPVSMLTGVNIYDCGFYHTVAVQGSGSEQKIYAWGDNGCGQLGTGDTTDRDMPTEILGIDAVVTAVSCSDYNSMALDENGHVWTWGDNEYGQIGDGETGVCATPYMLPASLFDGYAVSAIEAGSNSCFATTSDGRLWGWGESYTLGYSWSNDMPDTNIPYVLMDEGAARIAVALEPYGGSQYQIILTEDGTVYFYRAESTLTEYDEGERISDAQGHQMEIKNSDIWSGRNLTSIEGGGGYFYLIDADGALYAF